MSIWLITGSDRFVWIDCSRLNSQSSNDITDIIMYFESPWRFDLRNSIDMLLQIWGREPNNAQFFRLCLRAPVFVSIAVHCVISDLVRSRNGTQSSVDVLLKSSKFDFEGHASM